jgi:hypothetical protein
MRVNGTLLWRTLKVIKQKERRTPLKLKLMHAS